MMTSKSGYVLILFSCLTLCIITIDTRAINEEVLLDEYNSQFDIVLSNYRHRFEHSNNLKKLRWTIESRYNKAYCDFCNLVIPVVGYDDLFIRLHYFLLSSR